MLPNILYIDYNVNTLYICYLSYFINCIISHNIYYMSSNIHYIYRVS